MNVLVCGDRNWRDYAACEAVAEALAYFNEPIEVIHGDARGADRLAGAACALRGFKVTAYPAQWELYGRRAGPIRNQQMLTIGKPGTVIYFHDDLEHSKGTGDMVRRARKADLAVYEWRDYVAYINQWRELERSAVDAEES